MAFFTLEISSKLCKTASEGMVLRPRQSLAVTLKGFIVMFNFQVHRMIGIEFALMVGKAIPDQRVGKPTTLRGSSLGLGVKAWQL